jgi:hypothetical protein
MSKVEIEVPNEGPVVNGVVQLPDGSGVLPPFYVHLRCSQCGKDPRDLAYALMDKPCRCGRVAASLSSYLNPVGRGE